MNKEKTRIVISGVEGVNKGAELMLYAILSQIEQRYPNAEVFLPISQFPNGLKCIKTSLVLKPNPNKLVRFLGKYHITGILNRLGLRFKYLNNLLPIKDVKYYLDASGLYFSDQMIASKRTAVDLHILLEGYKQQGTKIIYLPQAYGPFHTQPSNIAIQAALKYSNLLIVRDTISMGYLTKLMPLTDIVKHYPDFTSPIHGIVPLEYSYLKNRVCIILNSQIVRKGTMQKDQYIALMTNMINTIYDVGYESFFLDHANDINLIKECRKYLSYDIPIVSNLDALSVKGIIGQSYLCISSRFHGVASAFSGGVPCLTTSWSHKYQELLRIYGMEALLLSGSNEDNLIKVRKLLNPEENARVKAQLLAKNEMVERSVKEMWECVWDI